MEYKMIIDILNKDNEVVESEIVNDKDTIIKELGYTLKENKEYSVIYSKSGLYDIVVYSYVDTKKGRATIRKHFELDLF